MLCDLEERFSVEEEDVRVIRPRLLRTTKCELNDAHKQREQKGVVLELRGVSVVLCGLVVLLEGIVSVAERNLLLHGRGVRAVHRHGLGRG